MDMNYQSVPTELDVSHPDVIELIQKSSEQKEVKKKYIQGIHMVGTWNNFHFSNWIGQGCPETDELNKITVLDLIDIQLVYNDKLLGFASEYVNKITLLKNLFDLNWSYYCDDISNGYELPKCPTELLERPGFQLNVIWNTSAYIQWAKLGSDAKLASTVTHLDLNKQYIVEEYEIKLNKFVNLKNLNLMHCGITSIPEEIYNLRELEYLSLSDNEITEISPKINKLVNLRGICCSRNKISSFPLEICELRQLKFFYYSKNALDVLHPDVLEFINSIDDELRQFKRFYLKNALDVLHPDVLEFINSIDDE